MISLLSDQDSGVRSGAAFALENCPEAAPHIAPALAARISDSDQRTRLWAARSLGHMLSEPRVVIPALIRALNDEDENVRGYACLSLENFGTNAVEAVPALRKLIEQFGRSEWAAIQALKVISPEATSPSRAKAKARAFDGPLTIGVPGS